MARLQVPPGNLERGGHPYKGTPSEVWEGRVRSRVRGDGQEVVTV